MTLNEQQLKIILGDLYAADPNLRQYEGELAKIIQEIIDLKPEIKFDENFRVELKEKLDQRARQLQEAPKTGWVLVFGGKFSYALAGAAVLAVIVIGGGFLAQKKGLVSFQPLNLTSVKSSHQNFEKIALKENAFGSLNSANVQSAPSGLGGGSANSASAPKTNSITPEDSSAGNSANRGSSAVAPVPSGLGGDGSSSLIMPAPPYVYYQYVYKGDALKMPGSSVEVLRRVPFSQDISALGSLLNSLGSGLVNLGSFSSLKVLNINLVEDKDLGYSISIDAQAGLMYISQNWQRWPQPYKLCAGEVACVDQTRLKISNVLSDETVIKIAKDFIASRGIDVSSYGEPVVTDEWRLAYAKEADQSQFYIPESANVLFPLKVNGQAVYDEGGSQTGINVSVDYRQKKVTNLSNLTSQAYEASNYAAERDPAEILKVVEQGGYWGFGYPVLQSKEGIMPSLYPRAKKLEIEVGTPSVGYVSMSNYNDNQTNFLLVPAFIFPIISTPNDANYYYPRTIVVPLAKELLDQRSFPPYVLNSSGASAGSATEIAPQQ